MGFPSPSAVQGQERFRDEKWRLKKLVEGVGGVGGGGLEREGGW